MEKDLKVETVSEVGLPVITLSVHVSPLVKPCEPCVSVALQTRGLIL